MPENDSTSSNEVLIDADEQSSTEAVFSSPKKHQTLSQIWESLLRLGLGETVLRIGTGAASIVLVLLVIWVMSNFYLEGQITRASDAAIAAPLATGTPTVQPPLLQLPEPAQYISGITRLAQLYTILPARPRFEIQKYTVVEGDTIIGIAEKFGLKPQTILLGNYYILADDPHKLYPDQELNILPADGLLYDWHAGDGLNGVAEFFKVAPEDIVNWPGNNLNPDTLGDWSNPNIEVGTLLFVPGGQREFVSFAAPRITRENPSVAKLMGPGACGAVYDGPRGSGFFIWPSVEKYLSGYDWSPETNHRGIDIAGRMGNAIYAADTGVVVYAGWNNFGYGNVVVIDHGNGWQTLYAHLDTLSVGCGSYVYAGDFIAGMGSTGRSSGPHLHFEMMHDAYGKVNPWDYLSR
jgi:murein DD-endopeptidase MepM/ murein hydrolase activator NlpD